MCRYDCELGLLKLFNCCLFDSCCCHIIISVCLDMLVNVCSVKVSKISIALTKGLRSKRQLFYTLRWPIYVFNSVVNTKLPSILSHRRSTTVSLETYLLYSKSAKLCRKLWECLHHVRTQWFKMWSHYRNRVKGSNHTFSHPLLRKGVTHQNDTRKRVTQLKWNKNEG